MSASEYIDMFYNCQERGGAYRMFAFDVIDSQGADPGLLEYIHVSAEVLTERLSYMCLDGYPFGDEGVLLDHPWDVDFTRLGYAVLGDAFALGWEKSRARFSDDDVMRLFSETVVANSPLAFRCGFADFDTLDYAEGADKFYAGYCFKIMTEDLKDEALSFVVGR